ncbi:hypothetical protein Dimus_033166 [Dionaea muscipula]
MFSNLNKWIGRSVIIHLNNKVKFLDFALVEYVIGLYYILIASEDAQFYGLYPNVNSSQSIVRELRAQLMPPSLQKDQNLSHGNSVHNLLDVCGQVLPNVIVSSNREGEQGVDLGLPTANDLGAGKEAAAKAQYGGECKCEAAAANVIIISTEISNGRAVKERSRKKKTG